LPVLAASEQAVLLWVTEPVAYLIPSLTAFASVSWNAPYYLRRGFRVLDDAELTLGCGRSASTKPISD
jgi:hypothetical protein